MEDELSREAEEAGGSFERGELSLSSNRQEEILAEAELEPEDTPAEDFGASGEDDANYIPTEQHDEL